MIRKTPANIGRLKRLAQALGAVILTPFYPVSGLFRMIRDSDSLYLNFMTVVHGIASFNNLRSRAIEMDLGGEKLWAACLVDLNRSQRCRMSSKPLLSKTKKRPSRAEALEALKQESELALEDQIRRLLAKPPGERTHFLRRKIGITGSCL